MAAATAVSDKASQSSIERVIQKVNDLPVDPLTRNLEQRVKDLEEELDQLRCHLKALPKLMPLAFPYEILGDDVRASKEIFYAALTGAIQGTIIGSPASTRMQPSMVSAQADQCLAYAEKVVERWLYRKDSSRLIPKQPSKSKG